MASYEPTTPPRYEPTTPPQFSDSQSKSEDVDNAATQYGAPSVQLEFDSSPAKASTACKDDVSSASLVVDKEAEARAKIVSVISIIVSIIVGIFGIIVGLGGGALAVIGLAGETLLDAISSGMVLWRYKKAKVRQDENEEAALQRLETRAVERERRFTLYIGIMFIAFAVVLLLTSLVHLNHQWTKEEAEERAANYTFAVSWPALVVFTVLAVVKFRLAEQLQSKTLRQDAICTVFGGVLALITGIASTCENLLSNEDDDNDAFGIVDPLASVVISLLILGEGIRTVYHNSLFVRKLCNQYAESN